MTDDARSFGAVIREARRMRRDPVTGYAWTQEKLGIEAGQLRNPPAPMNVETIARIEAGMNVYVDNLVAVAETLGLTMTDLFPAQHGGDQEWLDAPPISENEARLVRLHQSLGVSLSDINRRIARLVTITLTDPAPAEVGDDRPTASRDAHHPRRRAGER